LGLHLESRAWHIHLIHYIAHDSAADVSQAKHCCSVQRERDIDCYRRFALYIQIDGRRNRCHWTRRFDARQTRQGAAEDAATSCNRLSLHRAYLVFIVPCILLELAKECTDASSSIYWYEYGKYNILIIGRYKKYICLYTTSPHGIPLTANNP